MLMALNLMGVAMVTEIKPFQTELFAWVELPRGDSLTPRGSCRKVSTDVYPGACMPESLPATGPQTRLQWVHKAATFPKAATGPQGFNKSTIKNQAIFIHQFALYQRDPN